jgi:DNA-directed RNA polymerase subunit K/omega
MVVTPLHKIVSVVDNKYKAIVLVAKEARRLNVLLRENADALSEKPTVVAIKKLLKGEIQYKEEEE